MMAVAFWAAALAVVGWVAAMAVVGWVAVTVASAAPSLPAPARGRAQATRRTGQGQPGGVAQSFGRRDRVLALEMGRQAPAAGACVRGRPEVAITGHLRTPAAEFRSFSNPLESSSQAIAWTSGRRRLNPEEPCSLPSSPPRR